MFFVVYNSLDHTFVAGILWVIYMEFSFWFQVNIVTNENQGQMAHLWHTCFSEITYLKCGHVSYQETGMQYYR